MALTTVQQGMIGTQTSVPMTYGNLGAGNASIMKNRIINGAMVIDQRNAGASVTPTDGQFSIDRWQCRLTQASKYSAQQNAGSVTPPVGFSNYAGFTSLSAYSVGASDRFFIYQGIEGFNVSDLGFGTANAKTITLSAWVYSSLTGTFGGSITNYTGTRSYPFTYSIPVANTWTQIAITIAGDTGGTWVSSSNAGAMQVNFNLGTGTTFSGTAGSWASANYNSATGATSVVGTNGATFYITGVQLEVGSSATGYEYRQYGQELALCQRYFEKSYDIGTVLGTATENGAFYSSGLLGVVTTGEIDSGLRFQVFKRAAPTVTFWDASGNINKCNRLNVGVLNSPNQAIGVFVIGSSGCLAQSTGTANAGIIEFHYSASAEL